MIETPCVNCERDTYKLHSWSRLRLCAYCDTIQPYLDGQQIDRDGLWELLPSGMWVLVRASDEFRRMMRTRYFGAQIDWKVCA